MVNIRLIIDGLNIKAQSYGENTVYCPTDSYPLNVLEKYKETFNLLCKLIRAGTFHSKDNENDFYILGQNLYDILLCEANNKIRTAIEENIFKDETVRLELVFKKDDSFISWPWELLVISKDGKNPEFLIDKSNILFFRSIDTSPPSLPPINDKQLKILFVAAGPHRKLNFNIGDANKDDVAPLYYDEIKAYFESLTQNGETFKGGVKFNVRFLTEEVLNPAMSEDDSYKVTLETFSEELISFNPDILHIVAHGYNSPKGGQISFMRGKNIEWPDEETIFNNFGKKVNNRRLRLVFFQTCESAVPGQYKQGAGLALHAYQNDIHSVVAMQSRIKQDVANKFAKSFYTNLFDKENNFTIEKAFKIARQEAGMNDFFGIPVLYTRGLSKWDENINNTELTRNQSAKPTKDNEKRNCIWCGQIDLPTSWRICIYCGGQIFCKNCRYVLPPEVAKGKIAKCPRCEKDISVPKNDNNSLNVVA